jgi:hypothetical protein
MAHAGLVPGPTSQSRLRLEFSSWVERMATPKVQIDAIRALQTTVSASVTRRFGTEPDGSFSIDVALFQAAKPLS